MFFFNFHLVLNNERRKKNIAVQFLEDAEIYSSERLIKTDLNSDNVSKHLESGTETYHTRMLVPWDE